MIIPGINDTEEYVSHLKQLLQSYQCIKKIVDTMGVYYTPNKNQYEPYMGLLFDNIYLEETFII